MTAALRAPDLAPSGWLEPGDLAVIPARPTTPSSLAHRSVTGTSVATSPPPVRSRQR
jgi:hypothetical protein